MTVQLRIVRPVSSVERSLAMYCDGLGLRELDRFVDHQGFDAAILGFPGLSYHFAFTHCRDHPVIPAPTVDDLAVFYIPDLAEWQRLSGAMLAAGFTEVSSFNPYWQRRGRTFADFDGYRVVLQQAAWERNEVCCSAPS
ncbi:VOC family protein [Polaromonas sp. OV174]|uniref:VOC family protein n=1 Tax=Polaromonas sp. OV174 TaxID=1855300 RepID=UPI000B88BDF0|nr:VOC family protein [Polaromonas sp. OV174]